MVSGKESENVVKSFEFDEYGNLLLNYSDIFDEFISIQETNVGDGYSTNSNEGMLV